MYLKKLATIDKLLKKIENLFGFTASDNGVVGWFNTLTFVKKYRKLNTFNFKKLFKLKSLFFCYLFLMVCSNLICKVVQSDISKNAIKFLSELVCLFKIIFFSTVRLFLSEIVNL